MGNLTNNDIAIVLTIFDGYEDLWDDCIKYLDKYWPTHPQIYAFTNVKKHDWKNVITFPVGKDAEWSRKAQKAIEVVPQKYFILLLEDFYVGSAVNETEVLRLVNFMDENGIGYAKLCDNNRIIHKKKKQYKKGYPYEVIYQDEDYAISLQTAIWNKKFFKQLVGMENYNAWVFELNQVKKARSAEHVAMTNAIDDPRNILHIKHGALQGKMIPATVEYFEKIGDPLSTNRPVMTGSEFKKYYVKQFGKDITPKFAVQFVKGIAKKLGYSFVEEKWSK